MSTKVLKTLRLSTNIIRSIPIVGPGFGEYIFQAIRAAPNESYSEHLREPAAEMLGTMILILFGNGVDCQVVLSSNTAVSATPKGDYLSLNFGWACGTLHSSLLTCLDPSF